MKLIRYVCVVLLIALPVAVTKAEADPPIDPSARQIQQLIKQLGAKSYVQRQQARTQLQHLGNEAIEQLLEAQYDDSSEISLASRQLLGRLSVRWTREGEAQITHEVMRQYDLQSWRTKQARASWLAQLEDGVGFAPLCRIVRYESSDVIAKKAALYLIRSIDRQEPDQVAALKAAIADELGDSQRRPVRWLRALAESLSDPNHDLETWRDLVAFEEQQQSGPRSSSDIIDDLYQVIAELAIEQGSPRAKPLVEQLVETRKDDSDRIVATSKWLLDLDRADLFLEVIWNRFQQLQQESPGFLYCGADAMSNSGKDDARQASEELAKKAFDLTDDEVQFPDDLTRAIVRFNTTFALLEQRGRTDWAVREYRRLLAMEDNWQLYSIKRDTATQLAELLHDRGRDEEAADVLARQVGTKAPVFEREDDDAELLARRYYFRAEHYRKQGDRIRQKEFLSKATRAAPTDSDVLIAMHRFPRADEAWKQDTRERIDSAVEKFQRELRRLRGAGEIEDRDYRRTLATNLNQLAWLIGNTASGNKEAIALSRRSLELRPAAAGYLDTLGRAYFAVGDLENALRYQRRAARIEPHSQQILRQLGEFETAATQDARREDD